MSISKDLELYVKRFHEKVLDCYDAIAEKVLVEICLDGMMEYWIFSENSPFSSFLRLMEAERRTNKAA